MLQTVPYIFKRIVAGASADEINESFLPEAIDAYRDKYSRSILADLPKMKEPYKAYCNAHDMQFTEKQFMLSLINEYNICPKVLFDVLQEGLFGKNEAKQYEKAMNAYVVELMDIPVHENEMDDYWLVRQVEMIRNLYQHVTELAKA